MNISNNNSVDHKRNVTVGFVVGVISFLIYILIADVIGGSDEVFVISLVFGGPLGIIVSFIVGRISKYDLKKNLLVGTLAGALIGLIIVLILISILGPDDGVVGAFVIPGAIVGLTVAQLQSKSNDESKLTGATPSTKPITILSYISGSVAENKNKPDISNKSNMLTGFIIGVACHILVFLIFGFNPPFGIFLITLLIGGIIGGIVGLIVGSIVRSQKKISKMSILTAAIIGWVFAYIMTSFLSFITMMLWLPVSYPMLGVTPIFGAGSLTGAIVGLVISIKNSKLQTTEVNSISSEEHKIEQAPELVAEIETEPEDEIVPEPALEEIIDDKQSDESITPEQETQPLETIQVKSAFSYKGATILYKIKVENPTPEPIADIKITLFVPDVFLLSDSTKKIAMLKPDEGKTVTFEIRPTGECGDCEISGKVVYYDYSTKKTRESEIPPKNLSIVCPMLHSKEISEDAWRSALSGFAKAEESTKDIDMPASTLFDITSDILRDMNLYMLEPKINDSHDLYRAIARFYGEGVKELQYAAQIEVIGGSKKSRFILKAWAEREEALTGFYHGILDEIEKRVHVKGLIDNAIVQNIHQYGDRIGTQVKDSFVYKSSINDAAKTCPSCGREVGEDEQFCTECGERLI